MPAPSPDTGPPARVVRTAAAPEATATPGSGAPTRRLGLALAVIVTAEPMVARRLSALTARGVTDVSSPPDAPKPERRPEPGHPR
jgi:hypothetical protein